MNVSKELFLEELEAVKHCIEMTNDKIGHDTTRDRIVAVLNERIQQLEAEVDATIAAQEFGSDMSMDVA
jgi:predicted transglutaminase-like protease